MTSYHIPVPFFPKELLSECFGVEIEIVLDTLEGKAPRVGTLCDPLGSFRSGTRVALRGTEKAFFETSDSILQNSQHEPLFWGDLIVRRRNSNLMSERKL